MPEEYERTISVFNDAIPQIKRLDKDWEQCKLLRETGRLIDWYWKLDSILIELNYDARKIDKEKKQETTGYINKLNQIQIQIQKALVTFKKYELYQALLEKEKLLREIQEEAGKGAKRKPSDEDEMDM